MPTTYTLISSNVLTSTQTSVVFSSIPATYTDLVLKCSIRDNDTGSSATARIRFNGSSATNYSLTRLTGNGASASSGRSSSQAEIDIGEVNGGASTSNTFSNYEIYIPSYQAAQNKPIGIFGAQENNATTAYVENRAGLWRLTSAITSVTFLPQGANSFQIGSSFYLYGISNA
jgi:hypothetical protein